MNKPDILGLEVKTPDGRGSILSLHDNGVVVYLNSRLINQVMIGREKEVLHYFYPYEDVEIIKGQYNFKP